MNKRGVSLAELLAVVVIMGIIAAISIPLVGNTIEKTKLKSVYADALTLAEASRLYCSAEGANTSFCSGKSDVVPEKLKAYISNGKYEIATVGTTNKEPFVFYVKPSGDGHFYVEVQNDYYTYKGDPLIHNVSGGCYAAKSKDGFYVKPLSGISYASYINFGNDYCNPLLNDFKPSAVTSVSGTISNINDGNKNKDNVSNNPFEFGGLVNDKTIVVDEVKPGGKEDTKEYMVIDEKTKIAFAGLANIITEGHHLKSTNGPHGVVYEEVGRPYSASDVSSYNYVDARNEKQITLQTTPKVTVNDGITTIKDEFIFEIDQHEGEPFNIKGESYDNLGPYGLKVTVNITYSYDELGRNNKLEYSGEFSKHLTPFELDNNYYIKNNLEDEVVKKVVQTYLDLIFNK